MNPPAGRHDLADRFAALSGLLLQHQDCWRPIAFQQSALPWMSRYPALPPRLLALDMAAINRLATDNQALAEWMSPSLSFARHLHELCDLPFLPRRPLAQADPRFYAGIPGRKWQQVDAFVRCLPDDLQDSLPDSASPVLEWCAGKSHLGFWLQQSRRQFRQQSVTALEWDADLVEQANARAQAGQVPLQSHVVDVRTPAAESFVLPAQQVVALHACGDLHERLLQLAVQKQVRQLHLAPCCYHKRPQEMYQPLSDAGARHDLTLDKAALHTAVMETATAGATIQRQRIRLQTMRLGFDELQRDLRSTNAYLPVPSLPAHWARAGFDDFCRHCAALHGLTLPVATDWEHYWQRGLQRFRRVAAFDLVRMLFRRPLEIWLVLDRALLLEEQGYRVRLGQFCPAAITPRNLLLQGWRQ